MAILPQALRRQTPTRVRDDVRLRALALGLGLIPPRTMHSAADARVLLETARGARSVVEIGVYEGASALALLDVLGPDPELHLIDPFGSRPDALPSGWAANEWATRRAVTRAARRRRARADIYWHVALSHEVASHWDRDLDLVFIDGDHSEAGCGSTGARGSASSAWAAESSSMMPVRASTTGAACPALHLWSSVTFAARARRAGRSSPRPTARWRSGV